MEYSRSQAVWFGTMLGGWVIAALASSYAAQAAAEAQPMPDEVPTALVRVHLPLTGNADQALQDKLLRTCDRLIATARQRKDPRRPLLILQFHSHDRSEGGGSQFERVFSLARFLCSRQMAGVKTVAFLPQTIRGHNALLAVACEEIVMAPDAQLGDAADDEPEDGSIRQTVVAAYREIAETRLTIPVALAVGMIDPAAEVLQVETEEGIHFVLQDELEEFSERYEIVDEKTLVPAGTTAIFDGREGRQFGFVKYLADDLDGLAAAFDLQPQSIQEDDMIGQQWQPVVIDLRGAITPREASRFITMLGESIEQRQANWIAVRIDSSGGNLEACTRIANALSGLDANSVRTVAYVPNEAAGGAAMIALVCDQLVMHSQARLVGSKLSQPAGDPENVEQAEADEQAREAEISAITNTIRDSLAPRAEQSWSLLAAWVNPDIQLVVYRNKETGQTRLMSGAEAASLGDAEAWQAGKLVQQDNQTLRVDAQRAVELGLVEQTIESIDDLKQLYGLEGDIPVAEPNLALEFIEALASPKLAVLLLIVGFAGIYIELRTPGLGIGGFVASVAFLLFFWSNFLNGTAGWLEVLLFVAGVLFILMEIFVIPGFGIFGFGGAVLLIASIVLASLTFVQPRSERDMRELSRSLGTVALAGAGVMVFAIASRRYLPQAPVFRNVILSPPEPEEYETRESVADYSPLVGTQGVASTNLRPAGKAMIDHRLIDVIAEGEPIDRNTPIEVVEARANRVVVRARDA